MSFFSNCYIKVDKKDRQYNDERKKDKKTNKMFYITIHKNQTPLKTGSELRCSGRVGSINDTVVLLFNDTNIDMEIVLDTGIRNRYKYQINPETLTNYRR